MDFLLIFCMQIWRIVCLMPKFRHRKTKKTRNEKWQLIRIRCEKIRAVIIESLCSGQKFKSATSSAIVDDDETQSWRVSWNRPCEKNEKWNYIERKLNKYQPDLAPKSFPSYIVVVSSVCSLSSSSSSSHPSPFWTKTTWRPTYRLIFSALLVYSYWLSVSLLSLKFRAEINSTTRENDIWRKHKNERKIDDYSPEISRRRWLLRMKRETRFNLQNF